MLFGGRSVIGCTGGHNGYMSAQECDAKDCEKDFVSHVIVLGYYCCLQMYDFPLYSPSV